MVNRDISVNLEKIERLAKDHEITISGLESKAELANGTIKKWNKAYPTIKSLFNVAEVLGIDFWKLTEIK